MWYAEWWVLGEIVIHEPGKIQLSLSASYLEAASVHSGLHLVIKLVVMAT